MIIIITTIIIINRIKKNVHFPDLIKRQIKWKGPTLTISYACEKKKDPIKACKLFLKYTTSLDLKFLKKVV